VEERHSTNHSRLVLVMVAVSGGILLRNVRERGQRNVRQLRALDRSARDVSTFFAELLNRAAEGFTIVVRQAVWAG
jgi:hypothetical protein